MKNNKTLIIRALVSFIIGAAFAFIYVTVAFIAIQPEGKLRGIWLLTLFDYKAFIVFITSGALSGYFIKKPTKHTVVSAIILLIIGIAFWHFVDKPPLSEWLLP